LHTNERPYTCQGCDKKYISASGLRTHWKTTSCRPNNIEDELALAAAVGSPTYYEYGPDMNVGKYKLSINLQSRMKKLLISRCCMTRKIHVNEVVDTFRISKKIEPIIQK